MNRSTACCAAVPVLFLTAGAAAARAGDTPMAAYLAYRQVFERATSLKELLPYFKKDSRAEVEQMSVARLEAGLRLAKRLNDVKDVKVTKETVTGDTAVLEVTAVHADGRPAKANVTLAREDGTWRIDREDWGKASAASDKSKEKSCADLIAAMKGSSMPDSNEAAGEIWPRCPESVAALVEILSHESACNRTLAARVLGKLGPKARAGLPGMEAAAKTEKNQMVKDSLTEAIQKVRG